MVICVFSCKLKADQVYKADLCLHFFFASDYGANCGYSALLGGGSHCLW